MDYPVVAVDIVTKLLTLAKDMFDLRGTLRAAKQARREPAARFFEQVAATLEEFAPRLERGEMLDDLPGRTEAYADELHEAVGDLIGREKAETFARRLREAANAKEYLAAVGQAPDRAQKLSELRQAAGYFRGIAESIRARA